MWLCRRIQGTRKIRCSRRVPWSQRICLSGRVQWSRTIWRPWGTRLRNIWILVFRFTTISSPETMVLLNILLGAQRRLIIILIFFPACPSMWMSSTMACIYCPRCIHRTSIYCIFFDMYCQFQTDFLDSSPCVLHCLRMSSWVFCVTNVWTNQSLSMTWVVRIALGVLDTLNASCDFLMNLGWSNNIDQFSVCFPKKLGTCLSIPWTIYPAPSIMTLSCFSNFIIPCLL